MDKIKPYVHIVLLSIYPVIFLFTRNLMEIEPEFILIPISINLILTLSVFIITKIFIKNTVKTALLTSLFMAFVLNANFLKTLVNLNSLVFSILAVAIIVLVSRLIIKKDFNEIKFTNLLNAVSITLIILCFSCFPLSIYKYFFGNLFKNPAFKQVSKSISSTENSPDVYYIILDGYANNKALKKYYNYDNTEFLSWLENEGFFVAKNATSNYPCTGLSMPSSLNMRYINEDFKNIQTYNNHTLIWKKLNRESSVIELYRSKGYKFVFLPVLLYTMPEIIKIPSDIANGNLEINNLILNDFNFSLLQNSVCGLFKFIDNFCNKFFLKEQIINSFNDSFNYLSNLEQVTKEPKFIYTHILAPHPPYLFDRKGNFLFNRIKSDETDWFEKDLYIDYLIFINTKIKELITNIKNNSSKPPIIILQSDHGPSYFTKKITEEILDKKKKNQKESVINLSSNDEFLIMTYGILNAFYFPGDGKKEGLYDTITPVNSFRVLSNNYFNTELKLLEDKNYFGWYSYVSDMSDITEKVKRHYK